MKLTLNISPCPNDTFMFEALINGHIDTEGLEFDLHFDDIENLNTKALDTQTDICKISYAILPQLVGRYKVLDSGSALGHGNGPLLVSKRVVSPTDSTLKVAVPGLHTTANLLLTKLFPKIHDKHFMLFSEIADAVTNESYDAGVLIHEGRFTFAAKGLQLVADLGHEWEQSRSLPLPLGAIVIDSTLPADIAARVQRVLRASIEYAMSNPETSRAFIKQHAQELEDKVIDSHVKMFVNQYSISLGERGRQAISELTGIKDQKNFV